MAEMLKNMVNKKSLSEFAAIIKSIYSPFPIDDFICQRRRAGNAGF